jgi:HSP20 family protein
MATKHPLDYWRGESASPMREIAGLQKGIDRLFEDFFAPLADSEAYAYVPPVDVDETDTHYLLNFDLPGVPKDRIHIEVSDNQLRVSGERKEVRTEGRGKNRRSERYYGSFSRSFVLPSGVDSSKIEAGYENGVLHVAVPKTETAKAREITVGDIKEGGTLKKLLGKESEKKAA